MTFLYIPKCKPFYKFSLLTLQIQVGLKCNLAQTKGFGLSAIKTNIRDTFGVPDGLYDFFGLENEQNLTESCQEPLILNSSTVIPSLQVKCDSAGIMESLESMTTPPPPPYGYVLWQKQTLRQRTDAMGKPLPPHFVESGGWKFVRIEDLATSDRSPSSGFSLPARSKERERSDEPERLAEQAKVKEYIFTGCRDRDIKALHDYIEACNRAIHALDPANREARTLARFQLRMDMTILKESLKEELEVLAEEMGGDGYHGFDDGPVDSAELSRPQLRPKGYRWTCPGWL